MINLRSDINNKPPTAVIIAKDTGYKQLINKVSRQLAVAGCEVKTTNSLTIDPQQMSYVILVGTPSQQDIDTLNSLPHKLIIVARASELTSLKQELKKLPNYFLPHNYLQDLDATIAEILEVLMTQPPHEPVTVVNRPVSKIESKASPTKKRSGIKEIKPDLDAIVGRQYHFPLSSTIFKLTFAILIPTITVVFFLIYLGSLVINTKSNIIDAVTSIRSAQFAEAQTKLQRSDRNLHRLSKIYDITQPAVRLISTETDQTVDLLFDLGNQTNTVLLRLSDTGIRSQDFVVKLLQKQQQPIAPFSAYLEQQLTSLHPELIKLNEQYVQLKEQDSYLGNRLLTKTNKLESTLDTTLEILPRVLQIAPTLPEFFADNSRKKYLLIFQNNIELRPTGGFIGSVGFLSFENGKMLEIAIDDVYNLDGQLEGHVDPPEPILNYLRQPDWYLRDSNWHPDFGRSSAQIQWFLNKEVNTKVDGVFAVDLEAARYLLSAIGGVRLSDFDTFVTDQNLYLEIQNRSEEEFFPGATNKRDILGSLARNILLEISTQKDLDFSALTTSIYRSLSEKHILVNFNDSAIQSAFDNAGWTGKLLQPSCTTLDSSPCAPDYLMIVEANLGANKVNFFTEGNTLVEVKIDKNRLRRTVTINTTNNSNSHEFPGGTYKNYLRILTPPDTILEQVTLDNNIVELTEISRESVGQYQSWGVYLEIAPSKSSTLKLLYSSNFKPQLPATYELMVQKQPGSKNTPVTFSFEAIGGQELLPLNFDSISSETVNASQAKLAVNPSLLYNTSLNTDRVFKVKIQ